MIPTNKNIVVLHPSFKKKGGASSMMIYLSDFLKDNNNVDIYSFDSSNIKFFSIFKIAYAIRNSDYIIIGNSPMHFVGVLSKLLFRSKAVIIWWHHHYPWYYGQKTNVYIKLKRFFEKCVIKNIDSVIANSKYLQDSIKSVYKVDSKILYPVLDNKFLNHNSENKKISDISKTIFIYGRWVEGKNLKMNFKVYEDLKNRVPNLVLKIGGTGKELIKYKNKYRDNKNIIFLGQLNISQIIENLEQSNLFLFSSKIDSFGLVIIESMSIGVPVISYNTSGAKEIINNDVNGYLVDSDSEFIDKSYKVLNNSILENKLSIEAIKTAATFNEHTFKNNLSKIF